MTIPAEALSERLSAVREATLTALLEAQANALNAGAEIEAEPVKRSVSGEVRRDGPLDLPARGDLKITHDGRTLIRQVSAAHAPVFEAFQAFANPDFRAVIRPFTWDHAVLEVQSAQSQPSWTPLRHWFLEWFQSRPTELSPDLAGAAHRLDGPWSPPAGWRITVDLGSAPPDCIPALIAAIGQSGCAKLTIGGE